MTDKRLILISALIILLVAVFWGSSRYPALNDKAMMAGDTSLAALGFDALVTVDDDEGLGKRILYNTINWIYTNRQGMAFGLLLAALLMSLLPLLRNRISQNGLVNATLGVIIGAPLGVCVNCAAPIAKGLYSAGARVETALATMISSPTLNVMVLTMTFSLFPLYMATIKVGLTLAFILLVIPLLPRLMPVMPATPQTECRLDNSANTVPPAFLGVDVYSSEGVTTWSCAIVEVGQQFGRSLWFILTTTVPLMVLAGFLGSALITVLPFESFADKIPNSGLFLTILFILLVALIGLFLPVPMAFDVIVVAVLFEAGLPTLYAMVLLFTLGIFSIYSFSITWQTISKRIAVVMFLILAGLGIVAGGLGHQIDRWQAANQVRLFDNWLDTRITKAAALPVHNPPLVSPGTPGRKLVSRLEPGAISRSTLLGESGDKILVERMSFKRPTHRPGTVFTRLDGADIGFDEANTFFITDLLDSSFQFRGIAAGDIHNDGWPDIVLTTKSGPALYANHQGTHYVRQQIPISELNGLHVVNVALVDLNNDGWLDIFFSTNQSGNFVIYNRDGDFPADNLRRVSNRDGAFMAGAMTFGDVDRDGDLDIALGNWSIGMLTRNQSFDSSRNVLLENDRGDFRLRPLPGIAGETLSALFSDFNNDGYLDLLIGNDFTPSDTYYLGDGKGGLKRLGEGDGVIDHSTFYTMSLVTADINNDLVPEIYAGQVSAGVDNYSPEEICAELDDTARRKECERRRGILDLVKSIFRDKDASRCLALQREHDRDGCLAWYYLFSAIRWGNDPTHCGRFPATWERYATLCHHYFETRGDATDPEQGSGEIVSFKNYNVLLQSDRDGRFVDRAKTLNLDRGGWTWNAKFADVDNDEWQDLHIANGMPLFRRKRGGTGPNYFYHNDQGQTFTDKSAIFGLDSLLDTLSFTYIDFDNDGDLDIISVPAFGPVWVFVNNATNGNAIMIELRDELGNRFGIGSKIIIRYGSGRQQMREIQSGGGFLSFDAPIAHFGLGDFEQIDSVDVLWSTGARTRIDVDFTAGARYVISRRNLE